MNAECRGGPYDGKMISLPADTNGELRVQMPPKPQAAWANPASAIPEAPELRQGIYRLVESDVEEHAYLRWMGEL